jgi:hypothetical protein
VSDDESWGVELVWEVCGHQALVLGQHDLQHRHFCPICDPGHREPSCNAEYLDAH